MMSYLRAKCLLYCNTNSSRNTTKNKFRIKSFIHIKKIFAMLVAFLIRETIVIIITNVSLVLRCSLFVPLIVMFFNLLCVISNKC